MQMGLKLANAVDGVDKAGLSAAAVLVLLKLAICADDETGEAWPGDGFLVKATGLSRSRVVRMLGALEGRKLVRRVGYGSTRRFFILFDGGSCARAHKSGGELCAGAQVERGKMCAGAQEDVRGRISSCARAHTEKLLENNLKTREEASVESQAGSGREWGAKVEGFVGGLSDGDWEELQRACPAGADMGESVRRWMERVKREGEGARGGGRLFDRLKKWVAAEFPVAKKSGAAVEVMAEDAAKYGGARDLGVCGCGGSIRKYYGANRCSKCGAEAGEVQHGTA